MTTLLEADPLMMREKERATTMGLFPTTYQPYIAVIDTLKSQHMYLQEEER